MDGISHPAREWEQNHRYEFPIIPTACEPPTAVRQLITDYFVVARTKDWTARLHEYWQWLNKMGTDEDRYGKYDLIRWGETDNQDPELFAEILSECFDNTDGECGVPGRDLEAWKLRGTIAMFRRARIGTEFHGFMALPREIRDMVYGYALLTGTKFIVPNSGQYNHRPKKDLVIYSENDMGDIYQRYTPQYEGNLLRGCLLGTGMTRLAVSSSAGMRGPLGLMQGVSRMIQEEATEIFFAGTQLVFPAGSFVKPVGFNFQPFRGPNEEGYRNYARDVSYTFDMRDNMLPDIRNLYYDLNLKDSIDEGSIPPQQALQRLHDLKVMQLEIDWAERIDSIKRMTLDRLQLSFEECYCSIGCCRKVSWVLDRFLHEGPPPGTDERVIYSSFDWKVRPPLTIEVMGWRNDGEKTMISEKLGSLCSPEKIEVCFIADERT